MELKLILGILASIIAVIAYIPYILHIFQSKTEPHMYSWLVWALLQGVGSLAQFKEGAGYGAWALGIGALFCFFIFLLSFKYGTKNISKSDRLCLTASLIAVILYVMIDNPVYAIVLVGITDFVGFLPTFKKGFQEPHTETNTTYVMSVISNSLSMAALRSYNFTTIFYIASLLLTNIAFSVMIYIRRKHKVV